MAKNIAIITGASSGIGKEFFLTIPNKKSFDEIWVVARSLDKLNELKTLSDKEVVVISADLSSEEGVNKIKTKLINEAPTVKLLINASGYGKFGRTEEISLSESLGMIDLNCKALTALTVLCLPYTENGSQIIQIASIAGYFPIPYVNVYAASKAYVLSFTRSLYSELKRKGVRVMAVCPFWTKTAFFARAEQNSGGIVKNYPVVYPVEKVVKRAWRDLEKNKISSCYGGYTKMLVFLSKIFSAKVVMYFWKKSQKLS